jgi:hypothetical protein
MKKEKRKNVVLLFNVPLRDMKKALEKYRKEK